MDKFPSGIDRLTMDDVIAWKMVEVALQLTTGFEDLSREDRIKELTKLFNKARNDMFKKDADN